MRKPSACSACRARRRRCIWPTTGDHTVCEYCSSRGVRCVQEPPEGGYYHQRRARLQEITQTDQSASSPGRRDTLESFGPHADLPSMPLRLELVGLYFDYIHDQFHSLFHKPSFVASVTSDQVDPAILFAIFAFSARFSTNETLIAKDPRERGEDFRRASEALFCIRDVSISNIQLCVLLGSYAAGHGDIEVENLYYSVAGRLALALDLPNRAVSSPLDREVNIRIWWTICMVDVWSSTAMKIPRVMPQQQSAPFPMDDIPFLSLSPGFAGDMPLNPPTYGSPLITQMIKLNRVLAQINDFNKKCVVEHLEGAALEGGIQALSAELERWVNGLPYNMMDTPENFTWFASHGLGRIFAAVYLGYYYYGQLLYYQFLGTETLGTMTSAHIYADRCKDHAARLCELVYRSFDTPGSEVLYSMVAHVVVIASTVQIHTLLSASDETQIKLSRLRLERNFEILLYLRPYWTSVDSAMSRLRAFHQTCLKSNKSSFILDRWLLRFLVEFAPQMEGEPRDTDPEYKALWSLSKQQENS